MTKRATTASDIQYAAGRTRARRNIRRSSLKKRIKTFFAVSFLCVETLVAMLLVGGLYVFYNYSTKLPRVEDLAMNIRQPVATTIWSQDGVLLGKLEVENRQPVTLNEIPKNVLNATVAIEDHRFYEHHGIDVQGIARALWANVRHERARQGASTLTQQLVRNLPQFNLTTEKSLDRKLKEAGYALRMEQFYSKQEILQLYLNNIYYGSGAYGIQAASKTYFGKSAHKLSLAEAALLAGLPQRPSDFTPFENRRAAIKRRNDVLDRMLTYGYITPEQHKKALAEKPRLASRSQHKNFEFKAPYFTTYVLNDLMKEYGADYVYSGLRIETTLNWKMQAMAERALENGLENASGYGANQGALVSIDPRTGFIRTMVGGRSFHADQYNAVTQGRRQPGSTFKVFDYTAAFDTETADLHTTYVDEPIPYPNDPKHRVVKNYGGGYSYKRIDCLSAIKHSKNTIAVKVARDVGITTVIEYAHRMGITTELVPVLPTALGASAVRPLDLCSAYTVFPNGGNLCKPMALLRVLDADGNVVKENQPQVKTNILKPETVDQMNTAFEAVVTSGTGTLARGTESNGIVENAHGKTGTTSDNRDAWFAGFTPELATVIWVASVHRSRHGITYAEMPGATGGHLCAPIWHNFMMKAVPEQRKFKPPPQMVSLPAPARDPFAKKSDEGDAQKGDKLTEAEKKAAAKKKAEKAAKAAKAAANSTVTPNPGGIPDGEPQQAPPSTSLPSDLTPPPGDSGAGRPLTSAPPAISGGELRANTSGALLTTRPSTRPPVTRASGSDMVTVTVCVDTNDLANAYCDATKTIRVTARQSRRMRRCHLHKPPPGEE